MRIGFLNSKNVMRAIDKIIIHCSASEKIADAKSIKKLHIEQNGWKDIGYHYVIKRDGTIETGRSEDEIGAHCEGHNSSSIGVCLGGLQYFDDAQLQSMGLLVRMLLNKYNLTYKNVLAHYELDKKGKTCPNLDANLLRLYIKGD